VKALAIWVTIAAAAATAGFLAFGYPLVGQDANFHLNNLVQYSALFSKGVLIPRWAPGSFSGFGSALFYFYPPLCSALGSIVHLSGLSLPWSMRVVMVSSTLASVVSCAWYLSLLPEVTERRWWAAALYAIAPYPFLDVIIRSAYGEYLAMPWIPILLGSIELARRSEGQFSSDAIRAVLACGVALSAILLSSIPMFAVMMLVVPVYAASRLYGKHRGRCGPAKLLLPLAAGLVLAVLCTGYYWLPVLALRNMVHLDHVLDDSVFRTSVFVNLAKSNPGTRTILELYLLPLTAAAAMVWHARWRRERSSLDLAWTILLGLVVLIHIPWVTGPLSNVLPLMSIIQYPFRFYIILSLAIGVWTAVAVSGRDRKRAFGLVLLSGIGVLAMAGLFYRIFGHMEQPSLKLRMTNSAFEYAPVETPRDGVQVIKYCHAHENDPEVQFGASARSTDTCYPIRSDGNTSFYRVDLSDSMPCSPTIKVRFHRFYWPLWQITTSSGFHPIAGWDSNGVLVTALPAGKYVLKIDLVTSREEVLGERLSLAGVAVMLLLLLPLNLQKRRERQNVQS